MRSLWSDLRVALLTLRQAPGFGLAAIGASALGIGAATAIFSIVHAVLLRPLPYAESDRLVHLWQDLRARNVNEFPIAPGDYPDLRSLTATFEDLAGLDTGRQAFSGDTQEPEQIAVASVTPNFLPLIGAPILLGRGFTDEDAVPQPTPPPDAGAGRDVAPAPSSPRLPTIGILGHGFWLRRFGGDPQVIGRSFTLGGGTVQIVGVLAPGVELLFPPSANIDRRPDLWTALRVDYATASRMNVFMRIVARLRPGMTLARAQAQVDALAADLRRRFPIKQSSGMHFRLEPMHEDLVADVRPAVLTLMGAVVFVLLIACANVANLLLVRMSARTRELAVRAALGASRWRLLRQMGIESLVIAIGGALAGLVLAQLGIELLLLLRPDVLPRADDVSIDPAVLAFAAAAALAAALLFGLIPAWQASRPDIMAVLRRGGRTAGLAGGRTVRAVAVTIEVALAFVLLIGCGLMLRSFLALQRAEPGFDPQRLLTFVVQIDGPAYAQAAQRATFVQQLRERLRALPGVTAVTAGSSLPFDGETSSLRWGREEALADPTKFQQASMAFVLPGYFEAMRTPLIDGRTFTEADNALDLPRLVIDRRLAEKAFPDGRAVGRHLYVRLRTNEPERFEVIGVVGHQRIASLAADGREALYFVDGFDGHGFVSRWAVRTTGDPARLGAAVREVVRTLNPRLPVAEMEPMMTFVDRARASTRFALVLIGVFAAIAAGLAAFGLYGVLSTIVGQRTAEIGVRMAFGAPPSTIFRLMVGHGLALSAAGLAAGLAGAFALTGLMRSMLVGVEPTDPLTFAGMALVFLALAALASWLPARRAARLDPLAALRHQ